VSLSATNSMLYQLQRGYTPIHCAAYSGHITAMKVLQEHRVAGANLSPTIIDQLSAHKETPLHIACLLGNVEAVKYLCKSKAKLDSEDLDGNNLLHFISLCNSRSLWEWLLGMFEHENVLHKLLHKKNKVCMCVPSLWHIKSAHAIHLFFFFFFFF